MDLLTLGKVIKALSDKKGKLVPPYRGTHEPNRYVAAVLRCSLSDSTLTWVLRDVLGGNCMATMLVTCSPHQMQYTATQNTLEFADQCMGIQRTLAVVSFSKPQSCGKQARFFSKHPGCGAQFVQYFQDRPPAYYPPSRRCCAPSPRQRMKQRSNEDFRSCFLRLFR